MAKSNIILVYFVFYNNYIPVKCMTRIEYRLGKDKCKYFKFYVFHLKWCDIQNIKKEGTKNSWKKIK